MHVMQWAEEISRVPQFISVLSLGEIRKGIEVIKRKDPVQAQHLEKWLRNLEKSYADCILPVCERVAADWGQLQAQRSSPVIDSLLAATARVHHLTLVTRNVKDFMYLDTPIINPFAGG